MGLDDDGCDRLTRLTNPDNRAISYTYDAASNRTSVTTPSGTISYTYDERNRLDLVKQGTTTLADYDYDANNNLRTTRFGDGTTETRRYNSRDQLIHLDTVRGSIPLFSADYTLDKVGNRIQIDERIEQRPIESLHYVYDPLYRLILEPSDTLYTYDKVGNRLTKQKNFNPVSTAGIYDTIITYDYDENDRLKTEICVSANQNVQVSYQATYIYDNNGNTKSRTVTSGSTTTETATYTWDDENQLTAATITKGGTTDQMSYRYDADGMRVASIVNGTETRFLLDPNQAYTQVLEEYNPTTGVVQTSYVYGNDLISQKQGTATSYYHTDGLGSTRVLTNESGIVLNTASYGAFGEISNPTGSTANKYQFAGEQFDEKLGDYYLRNRYYDPATGRFTRRDSFEGSLSNPLSLHRYIYAHNNPVNGVDPSGYFTIGEKIAIGALIGLLASILVAEGIGQFAEGNTGAKLNPRNNYLSFKVTGVANMVLQGVLQWKARDGQVLKSWDAATGEEGATVRDQDRENFGPIPSGEYNVDPRLIDNYFWWQLSDRDWRGSNNRTAWGNHRVPVEPVSGNNISGRPGGFFIHGGDQPGTAGCIEINNDQQEEDFFNFLSQYVRPITLKVNL